MSARINLVMTPRGRWDLARIAGGGAASTDDTPGPGSVPPSPSGELFI